MPVTDSFFYQVLQTLEAPTQKENELRACVEYVAHQQGAHVNWTAFSDHDTLTLDTLQLYGKSLGLLLHKMALITDPPPSTPLYPIIIQLYHSPTFRILHLIKKNHLILYNPISRAYEKINFYHYRQNITGAWQCHFFNNAASNTLRGHFKNLWQHCKKDILTAALCSLFAAIGTLFTATFSTTLLNHAQEHDTANIFISYCAIITISLAFCLLNYRAELHYKLLNVKFLFFSLPAVINKILSLPLFATHSFSSGDLTQRLAEHELALSTMITTALSIFTSITSILLLTIYMAYLNPAFAATYIFIAILFLLIKTTLSSRNLKHLHAAQCHQSNMTSLLNEALGQIHKIRTSHSENVIHQKWLQQLIYAKVQTGRSIQIETVNWLLEAMAPLFILCLFYAYAYFSKNTFSTPTLLPLMIIGGQLTVIFDKLSTDLLTSIHRLPGLYRLSLFLSTHSECVQPIPHHAPFLGDIVLKNISLHDPKTNTFILDDISLAIKPGSFVAFVGHSGAGKSSLFKLFLGLESRYTGDITFDNQPLNTFNIDYIRKQFGVVLQTTTLFPGTIFSNIAANGNITLEQAWQLAKHVGLEDDINAMPMKMYTHLSDNPGDSISGGQRQKILIARALATQPTILLLDEATSALDNHSQTRIFHYLESLKMTRLVIAHRYSTIVNADVIYVLSKGKIHDVGTYHELVKRGTLT